MTPRAWIAIAAAGALSLALGAFVLHYRSLAAEAARVPALERTIRDKDAALAERDRQAEEDAAAIKGLADKIAQIAAARTDADAAIAAVTSTIRETAAATAEELAHAIPDDPHCVYGPDVGRLLNEQLLGLRPGHGS